MESTKFLSRNFDIAMKSNEYSYYFDDSDFDIGFFSKIRSSVTSSATSIGRASCASDLNIYKKDVIDFISSNRRNLSEANSIIRNYKLGEIEFEDSIEYSDIDLDTSAKNENWYDQFGYVNDQIEQTLDSFLNACETAIQQLELFKNNEYNKSIVALKNQVKKNADEQKELEKQNKKVVVLDDGKNIYINWKKLDKLPCHSE